MSPFLARASLVVFVLQSALASAQVVHSDRSSFQKMAGPTTLTDFEQFPVGPLCLPVNLQVSTPCIFSTGGVTFVATQVGLVGMGQRPELSIDQGIGAHLGNALVANALPVAAGQFYLSFLGSSIGFDVVTAATFGAPVAVELAGPQGGTQRFTVDATIGGGSFFGLTGLLPSFYSLSLFAIPTASGTSNFVVDNVLVAVPETETYALMLLGLVAVRYAALRRANGKRSPPKGH